jgi:hypothetical protein
MPLISGQASTAPKINGLSPQCSYRMSPLYFGGTKKENVNCMNYDEKSGVLIVGGNTTSDAFAPAASNHGFLFGFDLDGNILWGKFFYNLSYALSDITGCTKSTDGKSLTVIGLGNS